MSSNVQLDTLRRQARELADMEASGSSAYVDDTELNGMINASAKRWHTKVAQAVPERFESTQNITGDGSSTYSLPADHLWTLAVEYQETSGEFTDLDRVMFRERNRFSEDTTSDRAIGYRVTGSNLELLPPPSDGTYRHIYVSNFTPLSADDDTVDGVNGWEQWIVYDAAVKMLIKEETDPSILIAERNRIEAEILTAAADREAANPARIVDVRGTRSRYLTPGYRDPDFPTR